MTAKHFIKLSDINEFFSNENNIIKKGENALECNHVKRMQFDADLMLIKGEVHASMKNKAYNVEINLNKSGNIVSANCTCPRGTKCHHIATLALFGHYNISVTDKECTWNVLKQKSVAIRTAEQMYPPRAFSAIDRQLSEEERNGLKKKLHGFGSTVGFTWLLQEEMDETSLNLPIPIIVDIISSKDFAIAKYETKYFKEKCAISDEQIKETAQLTIGQTQNERWFLARKFRLTASNFGAVLACCMRNRFPPSLFNSLLGTYTLDGVKSIQWGRTHEKNGIEFLQKQLNVTLQPTGIWLTNSGLLGASPDGLLGDDSIVEVKCPYTFRNEHLSKKLKNNDKYIISYNDNSETIINKNHNYYHQIQGNLHILKKDEMLFMYMDIERSNISLHRN